MWIFWVVDLQAYFFFVLELQPSDPTEFQVIEYILFQFSYKKLQFNKLN